jgi:cyclophilin family peptidyl-prolyl cis-trans isomerase
MASASAFFALCACICPSLAIEHRPAPSAGQEKAPLGTPDVVCGSTKGTFRIEMVSACLGSSAIRARSHIVFAWEISLYFIQNQHPEWAPIGVKQFYEAVKDGVYDGTVIYRVLKNEAIQFGQPKDPKLKEKWDNKPRIQDDPQIFRKPNWHKGMISFAGGGPNTRGTDLFVAFNTWDNNGTPGAPWETPIGIIDDEGLKAMLAFNAEYGDLKFLGGNAPDLSKGYEALKQSHPNIDYLKKCTLVYPTDTKTSNAGKQSKSIPCTYKDRVSCRFARAFGRKQGAVAQLEDGK